MLKEDKHKQLSLLVSLKNVVLTVKLLLIECLKN